MNDLRVNDAFALDPFDDMFRGMLRPWRGDPADGAPQIRVDVHEDDEAKADAKYTDGVLQLRLPKRANAGSRRVTVG